MSLFAKMNDINKIRIVYVASDHIVEVEIVQWIFPLLRFLHHQREKFFSKKFFRVAPPCQSSVDYLFTEDPFKNFGGML